jgi:uncharacterized protein DUF2442
MSTSVAEIAEVKATAVSFKGDNLVVELSDGRVISAPLSWYPRLQRGSPVERKRWRLIGGGEGIHWPELDEDVSVENLVMGKGSGEGKSSLRRWWKARGGVYLEKLAAATDSNFQTPKQRRKKKR